MKYGYACINTTLRLQNVYVNRSMIKKTFDLKGIEYASQLALQNVNDLFKIIKWNHYNNITFYRMSSDMFPWMSEYEFQDLPNYNEIKCILHAIGNFVLTNKHRLTFHPGPFNILASPNKKIVQNTINEINKHAQIMDLLNLDQSPYAKINIHIGGVYKNKSDSLNRWCDNFQLLSQSAQKRLTIENDDKSNCYSIDDLMFVHQQLNIPIVIDYHHHLCHSNNIPLKTAAKLAFSTWNNITPVIHISESRDKNCLRAHSNYILNEFDLFNHTVDVMFEAKMKEQAVIYYRTIHK